MMVQPPAVMNCALSQDGNRQRVAKLLPEEGIDHSRLRYRPGTTAVKANESTRSDHASLGNTPDLSHLPIGFNLNEDLCHLRIGRAHLLTHFVEFRFGIGYCFITGVEVAFGDQTLLEEFFALLETLLGSLQILFVQRQ